MAGFPVGFSEFPASYSSFWAPGRPSNRQEGLTKAKRSSKRPSERQVRSQTNLFALQRAKKDPQGIPKGPKGPPNAPKHPSNLELQGPQAPQIQNVHKNCLETWNFRAFKAFKRKQLANSTYFWKLSKLLPCPNSSSWYVVRRTNWSIDR